jgi:LysR family transcriptional regulator (chromosome initiation inhibitor)
MKGVTQLDPVALRTLAVAVRLGTFEAAARELHVTPSAVSQRVKALETRVGRVLLHRVKPIRATEAGQVLVRLAAQVELLEREAVAELVESGQGAETGDDGWAPYVSIPLAVNADALYTWLIDALVVVQADHRVTFELMREDQTRTAERLRRGDVMAAITSDPEPVPGCRVVRLGTMRYLGVATPEYVAAHLPDGAGGVALERAPLIAFDRSDTLQHDFLRRLTRRRLAPPVTWIPSISDFDAAVRHGMGWGMLPERQATADLEAGRLVEIAGGRHVDVPLFWQHWRLESPVMGDLTAAMVAKAQEWLTA